MKIPTVRSWLILLGGLLLFPAALQAQSIRIRIGTVAPQDSPWHETLKQLRQEWHRISQGAVKVQIYPGAFWATDRRWSDKCAPGGSRR